jgi:hypothetical protein
MSTHQTAPPPSNTRLCTSLRLLPTQVSSSFPPPLSPPLPFSPHFLHSHSMYIVYFRLDSLLYTELHTIETWPTLHCYSLNSLKQRKDYVSPDVHSKQLQQ